jgi:hypothetical protein
MLTPRDWTLLAIDAASPGALTPVQLQKALFLIGRRLDHSQLTAPSFYVFRPYDYGPFSAAVYADAEALEAEGLAHIDLSGQNRYRRYSATVAGRAHAAALAVDPKLRDFVTRLVAWTRALSFEQLVSAIYAEYPEMKVNSVFAG